MRFHHYTAHFPDDYDIDGVTVTALLTMSGASATNIRNFLSGLAEDPSGLLTPSAPSPAGCKSGGLGAQDATTSDRGRECLPAPSLIPQRDVPGTQVPMDDLAPTVMQPSLPAAYTSMGAAPGGATVPASERAGSPAGSRDPECPKNGLSDPPYEANEAHLQPPLRLPPPESRDVAALHAPPPSNHASCKTRGPRCLWKSLRPN